MLIGNIFLCMEASRFIKDVLSKVPSVTLNMLYLPTKMHTCKKTNQVTNLLENVHLKCPCHFNKILQEHLMTHHSHSYNLAFIPYDCEFLSRKEAQNCSYIQVNM